MDASFIERQPASGWSALKCSDLTELHSDLRVIWSFMPSVEATTTTATIVTSTGDTIMADIREETAV